MRQAIETTETHVVKQHCNNQAHLLSRMKDFLLKDHKWHHSLQWIKKENLKKGCNRSAVLPQFPTQMKVFVWETLVVNRQLVI